MNNSTENHELTLAYTYLHFSKSQIKSDVDICICFNFEKSFRNTSLLFVIGTFFKYFILSFFFQTFYLYFDEIQLNFFYRVLRIFHEFICKLSFTKLILGKCFLITFLLTKVKSHQFTTRFWRTENFYASFEASHKNECF